MKSKKRQSFFRILSLAVLFCLVFAGCTPASDPEGLFGTPSSVPEVIREGSWDYELSEVPFHYGNTYTGLDGAPVCDYGEKLLFTGIVDGICMIYTYDKRTGKVETFCKDAVCGHDSEGCPVYGVHSLSLYNGRIYGSRYAYVTDEETMITSPAYQLLELKDGRFEEILSPVNNARYYEGYWYAMTNDGTLLKYPEENFKNPETLKEDLPHSPNAYIDHYYYFSPDATIKRLDLNNPDTVETVVESIVGAFRTDGEYLYYCDPKDYRLMRCDLDGSDSTPVTKMPVWPPSVNYDEEYIYFSGCDPTDKTQEINNQIFRVKRDRSSEPELVANVGFRASPIYTLYQLDALFLGGDDGYYILNLDGTGLEKLVLPE